MGLRSARWNSKSRRRERSHESFGSNAPVRPNSAVSLCGTRQPLDRRTQLYLLFADRTGILVAMAVLDCRGAGRSADQPHPAPVDWAVLRLRRSAHVRLLGSTDALHGRRQEVVGFAGPLHTK